MEVEERSIRIKLHASKSLLQHLGLASIEETPFIAVPCAIDRQGLSDVAKHYLVNELKVAGDFSAITFEFLDLERQVLVRKQVDRHLKKFQLSEEDVLRLEYSIPKVSQYIAEGPGTPLPDWISSLSRVDDTVFSGSFDGTLVASRHVPHQGLHVQEQVKVSPSAVTTVCAFTYENDTIVASGSKEGKTEFRKWNPTSCHFSDLLATCSHSTNNHSVQSISCALSSDGEREVLLASGGWKGDVSLFDIPLATDTTTSSSTKRVKSNNCYSPSMTLGGHTDCVTRLLWATRVDPVTLYSCGMDSTLRIWDCVRQVNTTTLTATKAFLALDYSAQHQLLASGHCDFVVRLWDARQGGDAVVKFQLKGHRGWVSDVQFEPDGGNQLMSVSYDRTCRIWDLRGGGEVQTIQTDLTGRLFAGAWGPESRLFLGGTDSVLRSYCAKA